MPIISPAMTLRSGAANTYWGVNSSTSVSAAGALTLDMEVSSGIFTSDAIELKSGSNIPSFRAVALRCAIPGDATDTTIITTTASTAVTEVVLKLTVEYSDASSFTAVVTHTSAVSADIAISSNVGANPGELILFLAPAPHKYMRVKITPTVTGGTEQTIALGAVTIYLDPTLNVNGVTNKAQNLS
jgi:hypothetical protein